jgi:hypothetical protein
MFKMDYTGKLWRPYNELSSERNFITNVMCHSSTTFVPAVIVVCIWHWLYNFLNISNIVLL